MKVYELTIKPLSGFGTPLKGDTIFGQFCWQLAYDPGLAGRPFGDLLSRYEVSPFAVFSSAWPKFYLDGKTQYALKTPALPAHALFNLPGDKKEMMMRRKECKAKKWMLLENGKKFSFFNTLEYLDDEELLYGKAKPILSAETRRQMKKSGAKCLAVQFSQHHNTINRRTGTTGEGPFAPYEMDQQVFYPETELALFVGIDEEVIAVEQVIKGMERIGMTGFGKDASTGLGRFDLGEYDEVDLASLGAESPNACYTLSPCVPEKDTFEEMFFTPFTRFGRHGDVLAKSANPFKNPVIMADEGGVFKPRRPDVFARPYIGRAVTNISKAEPRAVTQGYSLYIPVLVEV